MMSVFFPFFLSPSLAFALSVNEGYTVLYLAAQRRAFCWIGGGIW